MEVLLLADPIDDFWPLTAPTYKDKPFRSLTRGEVDLSKIEGETTDEAAAETKQEAVQGAEMDRLIALFKAQLGARVQDVRPSARLTDSVVCLVADERGLDMRLERFQVASAAGRAVEARARDQSRRHALIKRMAALAADENERAALDDLVELLLDQARIVEGEPLPDPGVFSRRMSAFLAKGIAA